MDRRRAAGLLLALAACVATATAAPTTSNHTALDLYDGAPEGCYYNFQHYGEGDRIMTNEPCLNCTCHNRMLMCYLRVCPFTKPIGQDCTIEKRADQCCPIVTCPDVPVDLLTSTTTSPAEYGPTGMGKLDKFGCSINGKYFSEGSKVPPTPNKPCEHCYCIRNMTTCVMQECTLHVDGCTPIYHKDVCCPVRYSCDHPEDEMPLLDDLSTTVRPTPGFLLTTTTLSPVTQMSQDCVYDNRIFPDGALIKTEKACDHCYCMKGDIVCVVQECGTPMENEGKNCTALPPREGVCCPDTYICEGDEPSTATYEPDDVTTITDHNKLTTLSPPRRTSSEGSGYRNEPDQVPYTMSPTIESEVEGSGEDEYQKPGTEVTSGKPAFESTDDILPSTEETHEYIPLTTTTPVEEDEAVASTEDQSKASEDIEITTESQQHLPSTTARSTKDSEEPVTDKQLEDIGSGELPDDVSLTPYEETSKSPSLLTTEDILSTSGLNEPDVLMAGVTEHESTKSQVPITSKPTSETEKPLEEDIEIVNKATTASLIEQEKTTSATFDSESSTKSPDFVESSQFDETTTKSLEFSSLTTIGTPSIKDKHESSEENAITSKSEDSSQESNLSTQHYQSSTVSPIPDDEFVTTESQELDTDEIKETKPQQVTASTPMLEEIEKDTTEYTETERIVTTGASQGDGLSNLATTASQGLLGEDNNKNDVTDQTIPDKHLSEDKFMSTTNAPTFDQHETTEDVPVATIGTNIKDTSEAEHDSSLTTVSEISDIERKTTLDIDITTSAYDKNQYESSVSSALAFDSEKATTEPDKGLNTIPSDVVDEEGLVSLDTQKTTLYQDKVTTEADLENRFSTDTENELSTSSRVTSVPNEEQPFSTTEPAFRKDDYSPTETEESPQLTTDKVSVLEEKTTVIHDHSSTTESYTHVKEVTDSTLEPKYTHITPIKEASSIPSYETSEASMPEVDLSSEITTTSIPLREKETTIANQEENEILNEPRIPGEGACLLNGITYTNESVVPSSNKCQSGCKCVSSIIKCDPIICSTPPEYMDNCVTMYDTPDACCPTYICDHKTETIPPQSHSQMSGTEAPVLSSPVDCEGLECGVSTDKEHHEECKSGNCNSPSDEFKEPMGYPHTENIPEKPVINKSEECNGNECTQVLCSEKNGCQPVPVQPCEIGKCGAESEAISPPKTHDCSQGEDCTLPDIPAKDCIGNNCNTPSIESEVTYPKETCTEKEGCTGETKLPEEECKEDHCRRKDSSPLDQNVPKPCTEADCKEPLTNVESSTTLLVESTSPSINKEDKTDTIGFVTTSKVFDFTGEQPISTESPEHKLPVTTKITEKKDSDETTLPRDKDIGTTEMSLLEEITTEKQELEVEKESNLEEIGTGAPDSHTTIKPSVDIEQDELSKGDITKTPGVYVHVDTTTPSVQDITTEPEIFTTKSLDNVETSEKSEVTKFTEVTEKSTQNDELTGQTDSTKTIPELFEYETSTSPDTSDKADEQESSTKTSEESKPTKSSTELPDMPSSDLETEQDSETVPSRTSYTDLPEITRSSEKYDYDSTTQKILEKPNTDSSTHYTEEKVSENVTTQLDENVSVPSKSQTESQLDIKPSEGTKQEDLTTSTEMADSSLTSHKLPEDHKYSTHQITEESTKRDSEDQITESPENYSTSNISDELNETPVSSTSRISEDKLVDITTSMPLSEYEPAAHITESTSYSESGTDIPQAGLDRTPATQESYTEEPISKYTSSAPNENTVLPTFQHEPEKPEDGLYLVTEIKPEEYDKVSQTETPVLLSSSIPEYVTTSLPNADKEHIPSNESDGTQKENDKEVTSSVEGTRTETPSHAFGNESETSTPRKHLLPEDSSVTQQPSMIQPNDFITSMKEDEINETQDGLVFTTETSMMKQTGSLSDLTKVPDIQSATETELMSSETPISPLGMDESTSQPISLEHGSTSGEEQISESSKLDKNPSGITTVEQSAATEVYSPYEPTVPPKIESPISTSDKIVTDEIQHDITTALPSLDKEFATEDLPSDLYTEKQTETPIQESVTTIKQQQSEIYQSTTVSDEEVINDIPSIHTSVSPDEISTSVQDKPSTVEQSIPVVIAESEKASTPDNSINAPTEKVITASEKPLHEITAPEEEFLMATSKTTQASSIDTTAKPDDLYSEVTSDTSATIMSRVPDVTTVSDNLVTLAPETDGLLSPETKVPEPPKESATRATEVPFTNVPDLSITSAPEESITTSTKLPVTSAYEAPLASTPGLPVTALPDDFISSVPEIPDSLAHDESITSATEPDVFASEEPITNVPKLHTTPVPEEPITSAPEQPEVVAPKEPITSDPKQPTTAVPREPITNTPEQPEFDASKEPITSGPKLPTTAVPGEPITRAPEPPGAIVPEEAITSEPQLPTIVVPGEPITSAPEQPGAVVPEEPISTVSVQPEVDAPKEPITNGFNLPTTTVPREPITGVPEQPGDVVPEEPITNAPEQSEVAPEESITSKPILPTPAVPEQSITRAPEQPEVMATEKPITSEPKLPTTEVLREPITSAPDEAEAIVPEEPVTSEPITIVPGKPVTIASEQPEVDAPKEPITSGTKVPTDAVSEEQITNIPEKPDIAAPEEPITSIPKEFEEPITPMPELPDSATPELTITSAPKLPETAAPEKPAPESPDKPITVPKIPDTATFEEPVQFEPKLPDTTTPEKTITTAPEATPEASMTNVPETTASEEPIIKVPVLSEETPGKPVKTMPEQSDIAASEEPITSVPQPPDTGVPDEPITNAPESLITVKPEEPTRTVPKLPETASPEELATTTPEKPSANVPVLPDIADPEETITAAPELPETLSTKEPITSVSKLPDTAASEEPTASEPEVFATASPEKPMATESQNDVISSPEEPTTFSSKLPDTAESELPATAEPELSITSEPQQPNIDVPEEPITSTPEKLDTAVPEQPITGMSKLPDTAATYGPITSTPKQTDVIVPEESITSVPKLPEATVPGESITRAPGLSVTATPELITNAPELPGTTAQEELITNAPKQPVTAAHEEPITSAPEKSDTVAQEEPITDAPKQPITATFEEPISSATEKSDTAAQEEPITDAPKQPITAIYEEPITSVTEKSDTPAQEEPITDAPKQPITATYEEPITSVTEKSDTAAQEEPITDAPKQPITATHEEPITSAPEKPDTAAQEEPITDAHKQPVTASHEEPITSAPEKTDIAAQEEPITDAPKQSVTTTHKEPITNAPEKPDTAAQEEPITSAPKLPEAPAPEEPITTVAEPDPVAPELPKPVSTEAPPTDEALTPDEEGSFPPSGGTSGYGQEPDYVDEDQTFGPGTCRYGGKVYVSAQQIPRDDPCDFCFCFRSDIICLQQSCPPPIHGCHEEPIQGFCCPRYECPVSMATTVNVTTTTTTTTTTLPPHFPTHSYKGSVQKRGCQIKGQTYKVGEVVRASSGPCLHCTCGGDGQMKCDPKVCTPEPMLRQMIAAAVSAKRRR